MRELISKEEKLRKFNLIELGRAAAAIFVVLHHAGSIMNQPRFYGEEPFSGHFRNFNVGVDFFFVLSGFIIAWIHREDIGHRERVANFAFKRVLRIFPPYWIILFFLVIVYQVIPSAGVDSQRDPLNIFLSIFLLPNPNHPILGVAWTLTYEIFFYAIFAALIFSGARLMWLLPTWAVAIILWNLGPAGVDPNGSYAYAHFPISFLLSAYNIEFLLGVAAAEILRKRRVPFPEIFISFGVFVFLYLMIFEQNIQEHSLIGRLAFSIPAMSFVLGAVEIERQNKIRVNPVLVFLGAASYAIYLVHPVALSFSIHIVHRIVGKGVNLELIVLTLAVLATAAGAVYHVAIEKRLIAFLSARIRLPSSRYDASALPKKTGIRE